MEWYRQLGACKGLKQRSSGSDEGAPGHFQRAVRGSQASPLHVVLRPGEPQGNRIHPILLPHPRPLPSSGCPAPTELLSRPSLHPAVLCPLPMHVRACLPSGPGLLVGPQPGPLTSRPGQGLAFPSQVLLFFFFNIYFYLSVWLYWIIVVGWELLVVAPGI